MLSGHHTLKMGYAAGEGASGRNFDCRLPAFRADCSRLRAYFSCSTIGERVVERQVIALLHRRLRRATRGSRDQHQHQHSRHFHGSLDSARLKFRNSVTEQSDGKSPVTHRPSRFCFAY